MPVRQRMRVQTRHITVPVTHQLNQKLVALSPTTFSPCLRLSSFSRAMSVRMITNVMSGVRMK